MLILRVIMQHALVNEAQKSALLKLRPYDRCSSSSLRYVRYEWKCPCPMEMLLHF